MWLRSTSVSNLHSSASCKSNIFNRDSNWSIWTKQLWQNSTGETKTEFTITRYRCCRLNTTRSTMSFKTWRSFWTQLTSKTFRPRLIQLSRLCSAIVKSIWSFSKITRVSSMTENKNRRIATMSIAMGIKYQPQTKLALKTYPRKAEGQK